MILSGIKDLITVAKAIYNQSDLDWEKYGIEKLITYGLTLMTAPLEKLNEILQDSLLDNVIEVATGMVGTFVKDSSFSELLDQLKSWGI